MNILFLVHRFYPDIGGIEVNAEILATEFTKAGHTVRLVTWSKDSLKKRSFNFVIIRNPGLLSLLQLFYASDVVFENNPCGRLSWPNLFFRKPHVIALRTVIQRRDGHISWRDKLKKFRLKNASHVIAVSEYIRRVTFPNSFVIGNPYRHDIFQNSNSVARHKGFLFVGRLVSDKGADLAIEALLIVRHTLEQQGRSVNQVTLTVVGDGPERQRLEEHVAEAGLLNIVHFMGKLYDRQLAEVMQEHRYLLVPSIWKEPFGNVALEGLACGCIPIVADGGGLPDAVGKAGLVFKRGDTLELASTILRVLNDADSEQSLRESAPAHLALHKPEIIAKKYLEVLESARIGASR